jgi:HD superfamily phosphohydrolase
MPKWGLTPEQRDSKPWGLTASVLQPAKVITDPVHGDIYVTELERRAIDSPTMQRLRRVRQLGTTHLVYPGATHTRFSHSLGALRSAQDLLDIVVDHRHGPHPTPDLFAEWKSKLEPDDYNRHVAEATVLARLGALLHDMSHVPFGHTVEDDLGLLEAHDSNTTRFEKLWSGLSEDFRSVITPELREALRDPLILSKLDDHLGGEPSKRYPFVADIVGNTICADLIDYLQRDHAYTGLPAKLGNRFIQGFYVTRSDHVLKAQRMVLQIARNGRARRDVVSELFKYLRYRYELSERALVHHAKLAADAMVGKLLEMWRDSLWNDLANRELGRKDKEFESDLNDYRRRITIRHQKPELPNKVDALVTSEVEDRMLRHGDDGLLEYILEANAGAAATKDRRKFAVHALAEALLNRRLFKLIGRCSDRTLSKELFERFGAAAHLRECRQIEEEVSSFVGLQHRWHVLLWIPSPKMRLKAADVLVDDGSTVAVLQHRDRIGENRGREIYDAHESLWSIGVYAHPDVAQNSELCHQVLAWLSVRLGGIQWEGLSEQPSLSKLAAREVGRQRKLTVAEVERLASTAQDIAAHGPEQESFAALVSRVQAASEDAFGNQHELELDQKQRPPSKDAGS